MKTLAFDAGIGFQRHCSLHLTEPIRWPRDRDVLRHYVAFELGILSEYKSDTVYVALNVAIDMKLAFRRHIAGYRKLFANCGNPKWTRILRANGRVHSFSPPRVPRLIGIDYPPSAGSLWPEVELSRQACSR